MQNHLKHTIWDSAVLAETQAPGADSVSAVTMETDSTALPNYPVYDGGTPGAWVVDPNPYYGRVAYTPGIAIDQPLSVTRYEFQDSVFNVGFEHYTTPFTLVPHWNSRGAADMGTFEDGGAQICGQGGIPSNCLLVVWPFGWTVYQQQTHGAPAVWYGTQIEQKRDGTGLLYRRNRYIDPSTGRFSQEDPIGLSGGMNAYGYASGDPVNLGDPFGLDPCKASSAWTECLAQALANWGALRGGAFGDIALNGGAALNAAF